MLEATDASTDRDAIDPLSFYFLSEESGEPNFRELEPDRCVAETAGGAPRRRVKLILRPFRLRQTQEYKNGAVERLHFSGGQ